MKKQYIIPATDVIEIRVSQMLTTSTLDLVTPVNEEDQLGEGEILSREGEFDEDDFDMDEEDI